MKFAKNLPFQLKSWKSRFLYLLIMLTTTGCASFSNSGACRPSPHSITDVDFEVRTLSYSPQRSSDKTLYIFPPTGGTNTIDRSYASDFCQAGYQVHILEGWTNDIETEIDFTIHQNFYSKAQKALGLLLDKSKTKFNGLIGTSVGGLHASVAASLQDKLDAVFVITAGTPISEVVVYSHQKAMRGLNEKRKQKFKTNSDIEQVQKIDEVFHLEPLKLGEQFKKKDLGVSVATKDTVVPYAQQKKLRDLWSPKKEIYIHNDHFWGIVKTWFFHTDDLIEFFEQSAKSRQ